MLPSEKAENKKDKRDLVGKEREVSREAINKVFSSEEGRVLFKWLYSRCGFDMPSAVVTTSGLNINDVVYNESRRNLYLDLRDYIHKDLLSELEKKESEY